MPTCNITHHVDDGKLISNNCSTAFANGSCEKCASGAFRLLSNGKCEFVDCGDGGYFGVNEKKCLELP